MKVLITFTVCLVLVVDFQTCKGEEEFKVASYVERRRCPYWQQSGCLLAVIEELCDFAGEELEYIDLRHSRFSDRCCCPKPMGKCGEDEKNPMCKELYDVAFPNRTSKTGNKEKLVYLYNFIRTRLLKSDNNCQQFLASAEAAECSQGEQPPLKRQDHKCESMLWMYEDLGGVTTRDVKEAKCPYDKKLKGKRDRSRMPMPGDEEEEGDEDGDKTPIIPQVYSVASYQDRRKCKYWQQSGCFLDALEKVCEAENDVSELLSGRENIFLCCCPEPYVACRKSDPDTALCLKKLRGHFDQVVDSNGKGIKGKVTPDFIMKQLQSVRKELFELDSECSTYLAPVEPFAECSKQPLPFSRHDLKCEMLSWQWEELGDGNKKEFDAVKCPFVKKDKAKNGNARKGATGFLDEQNDKVEL